MAVLIEGISVLVRKDSIQNNMRGGDARFRLLTPQSALCEDDHLVGVGFLDPADVESFIEDLKSVDLIFLQHGQAIDIAVCDQQHGLTADCDWLELCQLPIESGKVTAAWFFEGERKVSGIQLPSSSMKLATPPGWEFKDSLSEKFQFVPGEVKH